MEIKYFDTTVFYADGTQDKMLLTCFGIDKEKSMISFQCENETIYVRKDFINMIRIKPFEK